MQIEELKFKPLSDMGANDKDVIDTHAVLINEGEYTEATNYLNEENYDKGARASFFNELTERMNILGTYISNKEYSVDEIYLSDEPTEDVDKKTWWLQPPIELYYYNSSSNDEGIYTNCVLNGENNITLGSYTNALKLTGGKYANGADAKKFIDHTSYIELNMDLSNIRKLKIDAYLYANNNFTVTINDAEILNYTHQSSSASYTEITTNIGKYSGECIVRIGNSTVTYGLNIFGIIGLNM